MNVQLRQPRTKAEFYAWLDTAGDGRFEFVEGRIRMMNGASRSHNRIATNLLFWLRARLPVEEYEVYIADFGVETEDSVRFPDVVVEPAGGEGTGRFAPEPLVVVEILSPSTTYVDIAEKPLDYGRNAATSTYLVPSQDERRAWVWQRGEDGAWPTGAREIVDDAVPLPRLGLVLPMADVYRGVA